MQSSKNRRSQRRRSKEQWSSGAVELCSFVALSAVCQSKSKSDRADSATLWQNFEQPASDCTASKGLLTAQACSD